MLSQCKNVLFTVQKSVIEVSYTWYFSFCDDVGRARGWGGGVWSWLGAYHIFTVYCIMYSVYVSYTGK